MKIIVGNRRSGNIKKLIELAAEAVKEGKMGYIVCHSHQRVYEVVRYAESMGLVIPYPLTFDELDGPLPDTIKPIELYLDSVEILIKQLVPYSDKMEAATFDSGFLNLFDIERLDG